MVADDTSGGYGTPIKKEKEPPVDAAREEKLKKIELAQAALNKQFGKGAIFRYRSDEKFEWPAISTGALTLDIALGIGGVPKGRIIEVYGAESAGKSTLCMTIVGESQKQGGVCAYIDAEHALDPGYAEALGVNFDDLLISQPDYGEMALDTVETLAKTGAIDLIVVDSVASLVPKAELEGTMHDSSIALQARMMSQHLRRVTAIASQTQTTILFVNQIRHKVGVFFGSPEVTSGGNALKFYSSVRLDIRRAGDVKLSQDKIGHTAKVKVVKNRMAPPFKIAEFDILWGRGINKFGCVLDLAEERGLLIKSGTWYKTANEEPLGQGRMGACEALANDLELYEKLKQEILNG